jgi:hypothetical protein
MADAWQTCKTLSEYTKKHGEKKTLTHLSSDKFFSKVRVDGGGGLAGGRTDRNCPGARFEVPNRVKLSRKEVVPTERGEAQSSQMPKREMNGNIERERSYLRHAENSAGLARDFLQGRPLQPGHRENFRGVRVFFHQLRELFFDSGTHVEHGRIVAPC